MEKRKLPDLFCKSMEALLGDEYQKYLDSYQEESYASYRINLAKIPVDEWEKVRPFKGDNIPWISHGYYYDPASCQPAKHPFYYAGLYYIQEPSAMIPASLLPVKPGDKVLDLCAAPGGKATELAAKLQGKGLLVANDISVSRAMALAKNLQMAGAQNTIVTAETPEKLANHFGVYFDKILIDAPCSGEGMFRRDPSMIRDWEEHGPAYYAQIQKKILNQAYQMLMPDGMLVYSTCTFSPIEDEKMIEQFLIEHSDMEICPVDRKEGYTKGFSNQINSDIISPKDFEHAVRIFPHRTKGEGHFAILLHKKGQIEKRENSDTKGKPIHSQDREDIRHFAEAMGLQNGRIYKQKNQWIWEPACFPNLKGLRMIQAGTILEIGRAHV